MGRHSIDHIRREREGVGQQVSVPPTPNLPGWVLTIIMGGVVLFLFVVAFFFSMFASTW